MLIGDVLQHKKNGRHVVTIAAAAQVTELLTLLADRRIGAVVVSDDGEIALGIVSERDIVRKIRTMGPQVLHSTVGSIMTPADSMITAAETGSVEYVMGLMTVHRVRHVPVLEEGRLIGVVSIGDLVKSRIDDLQSDRSELMEYVAAGF